MRVAAPPARPTRTPLIDHPMLDRMIRGRAWIALIAISLTVIVAMQVTLLKLNTGIGSQIQRAQLLSRTNALLGAQVSALEAADRIQGLAAQRGMVPAPAGDVRYLQVGRGDAPRAAAMIVAPKSTRPSSADSQTASVAGSAGTGLRIARDGATGPSGTNSAAGAPAAIDTTSNAGRAAAGDPSTAVGATAAAAPATTSAGGVSGRP
ncbi:MAG: hypothetical protein NVSMB51_03240 [Solirubrobacteraceae bacterium]